MPSTMVKLKMNPRKRKMTATSELHFLEDWITAMLRQEDSYLCGDYLSMTCCWSDDSMMMENTTSADDCAVVVKKGGSAIDEYCREQICEWTYRVVDYFRIDREVVCVSMNYLDRFLCTCICDRSMFKLAATTTLYMAVKVVHPQKLGDLGMLSDLSRGEFQMKDVADMEERIMNALQWKLHPPTAAAFTVLLLDFLQLDLAAPDLEDVYTNASFFAELSVCDYYFTTFKPSTISLACALNALEGMHLEVDFGVIEAARRLGVFTRDLSVARNRLWELYERSEECALHKDSRPRKPCMAPHTEPISFDAVISPESSPVSVNADRCKADYWPMGKQIRSNGSW